MRKSGKISQRLFAASVAAALLAYLLPGDYILEKVSDHTKGVKGLYVQQKAIIHLPMAGVAKASSPDADEAPEQGTGKVGLPDYEPPPDGKSAEALIDPGSEESRYCQWARDSEFLIQAPDSMRLRVFGQGKINPPDCPCTPPVAEDLELLKAGGKAAIIKKDSMDPVSDPRKWFFADFLVGYKAHELKREMLEFGVDLEHVRLVLVEDKVAYMVGAEDEGSPRVWLDKDSFLPLRVSFSDSEGHSFRVDLQDYQYLGQEGVWYPGRIDFYEDDLKRETYQMVKVVVNPRLKPDVFNAQKIQASLKDRTP